MDRPAPAGGERLAHYGIAAGAPPPRWVSELAEELAALADNHAGPWLLGQRIKEEAARHGIRDVWFVTQLVAHEWDRLGIARIPGALAAGGW